MIATYVFAETSPNSNTNAASQNPVSGSTFGNGIAGGLLEDAEAIDIVAELIGATGGTLDVYVQTSSVRDANNNPVWYDVVHFAQLASGAPAVVYRTQLSDLSQPVSAAPVPIGKNNSPALAVATVVQSIGFDKMRLFFVAGAGTTQGASVRVTVTCAKSYTRGGK